MRTEVHEGPDDFAALRGDWRELESRALEPNAYLSARFILPALSCLPGPPAWILTVWDQPGSCGGRGVLRGLGVFQSAGPRLRFPLGHALTYGSVHSYLSGFLLDADRALPTLHAMLDALARRTGGLALKDLPAAGATAQLLRGVVAERGGTWHEDAGVERACIDLGAGNAARWRSHVSASRLKGLERQWRKLGEVGEPGWRYLRGEAVSDDRLERFLALEHAGWKGQAGTSLRSDPRQEAFFRGMTAGFRADGDLFFTELLLDGQAIASSCNLCSGPDGFAFKVAFDPRFAKYGPGLLNELGFLKALEQGVDRFRFIDSGAAPGSFIEELWPDRVPLYAGAVALGRISRSAARAADALSRTRRRLFPGAAQRPAAA